MEGWYADMIDKTTENLDLALQEECKKNIKTCCKCPVMKKAMSKNKEEYIGMEKARKECDNCEQVAINEKFDTLYQMCLLKEENLLLKRNRRNEKNARKNFYGKRNKGKKSLVTEHEKKVIKELRADGFSYQAIADKTGYSKGTIWNIVQNT